MSTLGQHPPCSTPRTRKRKGFTAETRRRAAGEPRARGPNDGTTRSHPFCLRRVSPAPPEAPDASTSADYNPVALPRARPLRTLNDQVLRWPPSRAR
jgi:hypothetical protein